MSSKITETAAALAAKIAQRRATSEQLDREIVDLQRRQAWAAGAEQRATVETVRAAILGAGYPGAAAELHERADAVRAALVDYQSAAAAHNDRVREHVQALADAGVPRALPHAATLDVPSPATCGVGRADNAVQVDRTRIATAPTDLRAIADAARLAAEQGTPVRLPALDAVVSEAAPLAGRWWQTPDGGVLRIDNPGGANMTHLREISRREARFALWGVVEADLPAEIVSNYVDPLDDQADTDQGDDQDAA